MESKIMIDISYASREPQIKILLKESDDPRDTLVSMFVGECMPGVHDGYCRIERYAGEENGAKAIVITPISPVKMIDHIPTIANYAETNAACDTSRVPERYREILGGEMDRVFLKEEIEVKLYAADAWAVRNMPHDLYKKWTHEIMYPGTKEKPKTGDATGIEGLAKGILGVK